MQLRHRKKQGHDGQQQEAGEDGGGAAPGAAPSAAVAAAAAAFATGGARNGAAPAAQPPAEHVMYPLPGHEQQPEYAGALSQHCLSLGLGSGSCVKCPPLLRPPPGMGTVATMPSSSDDSFASSTARGRQKQLDSMNSRDGMGDEERGAAPQPRGSAAPPPVSPSLASSKPPNWWRRQVFKWRLMRREMEVRVGERCCGQRPSCTRCC